MFYENGLIVHKSYGGQELGAHCKGGKVFDFSFKSGLPAIFDLQLFCGGREITIGANGKQSVGGIKEKGEITSIKKLRDVFDGLISDVQNSINSTEEYILKSEGVPIRCARDEIDSEDRELLVGQLTFDVLFQKYVIESPKMTLRQYCQTRRNKNWHEQPDDKLFIDSLRHCISEGVERQKKNMNTTKIRKQLECLGVVPDEYFEEITKFSEPFHSGEIPEKVVRSKPIWDYIYYNSTHKLITGKQYARSFSKNGNYSYHDIAKMLDVYEHFVNEYFMQTPKDSREYFTNSLDYYSLEIYKRIDFIYKLAVNLEESAAINIDKNHALVKRFHPDVVVGLYNDGNEVGYLAQTRFYRPMLMLEDLWQRQKRYEDPLYGALLENYRIVRAKAIELFKYHFKYVSDDYDDISDFIQNHFNILEYHDSQKEWVQKDKKRKKDCYARIAKALEINEALFGISDRQD